MPNNIVVTYIPQKFDGNKLEDVSGITYGIPTYSEAYYYAFIQNENYTANGNSYQEALNKLFKNASIDIDVSTISNIVLNKTTLIISRSNLYIGMTFSYINGNTISVPHYDISYIVNAPYYDIYDTNIDFNACLSSVLQNKIKTDVKSYADITNIHYDNCYPTRADLYATIIKKSYDITEWWVETKYGTYSFIKNGSYSVSGDIHKSNITDLLKDTDYDYRFCTKENDDIRYSSIYSFTTPDVLSFSSVVINNGEHSTIAPTVSFTFNYTGHNIKPDYYRYTINNSMSLFTASWITYSSDTIIYKHNFDKYDYQNIYILSQLRSTKNETYSEIRDTHINYFSPKLYGLQIIECNTNVNDENLYNNLYVNAFVDSFTEYTKKTAWIEYKKMSEVDYIKYYDADYDFSFDNRTTVLTATISNMLCGEYYDLRMAGYDLNGNQTYSSYEVNYIIHPIDVNYNINNRNYIIDTPTISISFDANPENNKYKLSVSTQSNGGYTDYDMTYGVPLIYEHGLKSTFNFPLNIVLKYYTDDYNLTYSWNSATYTTSITYSHGILLNGISINNNNTTTLDPTVSISFNTTIDNPASYSLMSNLIDKQYFTYPQDGVITYTHGLTASQLLAITGSVVYNMNNIFVETNDVYGTISYINKEIILNGLKINNGAVTTSNPNLVVSFDYTASINPTSYRLSTYSTFDNTDWITYSDYYIPFNYTSKKSDTLTLYGQLKSDVFTSSINFATISYIYSDLSIIFEQDYMRNLCSKLFGDNDDILTYKQAFAVTNEKWNNNFTTFRGNTYSEYFNEFVNFRNLTTLRGDFINVTDNSAIGATTGVFSNDTSLKEITIPANIKYFNGYDFYGCTALSKITFATTSAVLEGETPQYTEAQLINWDYESEFNQYYETCTFYGCSSLTSLDLSNLVNLQRIRPTMFEKCKLTTITLPVGKLTHIQSPFKANYDSNTQPLITLTTYKGNNNYHTNSNGTSVLCSSFPSTLKWLGGNSFWMSNNMKGIVIPNNITYFGDNAFRTNGYNNGTRYVKICMDNNGTIDGNPFVYNQKLYAIHFTEQTAPVLTSNEATPATILKYMGNLIALVVADDTAKNNYKNATSWNIVSNNYNCANMYNALGKTSTTCSPSMLVITESEWATAKAQGALVVTNLTTGATSSIAVSKTCEDI